MIRKLYSQMTTDELAAEMKRILEEKERAEFPSQRAILDRKYLTAKAYTLNPSDFPQGVYKVDGVQLPFEVDYLNGIMAWGRLGDDPEASFPISMLSKL